MIKSLHEYIENNKENIDDNLKDIIDYTNKCDIYYIGSVYSTLLIFLITFKDPSINGFESYHRRSLMNIIFYIIDYIKFIGDNNIFSDDDIEKIEYHKNLFIDSFNDDSIKDISIKELLYNNQYKDYISNFLNKFVE